jgi:hypothetical protein
MRSIIIDGMEKVKCPFGQYAFSPVNGFAARPKMKEAGTGKIPASWKPIP